MATVEAFLAAALSEVGYVETPVNLTKFAAEAGHPNGQPWCATFLVAIAHRVGVSLPSESPYTPAMAAGFQKAHRWFTDPQPGDIAFVDFPDALHGIQHVWIVEAIRPDGQMQSIEGNTSAGPGGSQHNGGGVYRRVRPRSYVVGFGRPRFSTHPPQEPVMTPEQQAQLDRIEKILLAMNHEVAAPKEGRLYRVADGVDRLVKKLGA